MMQHYRQINKRLFLFHSTLHIYAQNCVFDWGFQILFIKFLSFVREVIYKEQAMALTADYSFYPDSTEDFK